MKRTPFRQGPLKMVGGKIEKEKSAWTIREIETAADVKRDWALCRAIVILRDEGICIVCNTANPKGGIHVHHWLLNAGACERSRYLIENLVSLCKWCHEVRVHIQGDPKTIYRIYSYMGRFIPAKGISVIRAMRYRPAIQRRLEDYLELEIQLGDVLEALTKKEVRS